MKIQANEIKVGQIIWLNDLKGEVLEIKESFQKNGKRLIHFLVDSPERVEVQRGYIKNLEVIVPAKKYWEKCKETTKVKTY